MTKDTTYHKLYRLPVVNSSGNELPIYMSEYAAGMDIRAHTDSPIVIQPGRYSVIPTGISIAIPQGYELQVRARSGLAFNHGIGLVNGVGTIDSDYRGEIKVLLVNHGHEVFRVENGDRIAQIVLAKHERIEWVEVDSLEETKRNTGGLGSTGRS